MWAASLGSILVLGALWVPGAAAFEPQDFDVELDMGGMDQPQQPDCTPQSDGTQLCTVDFTFVKSGMDSKGTVTQRSTGDDGTIEVSCDINMEMHMAMRTPAMGGMPSVERFDGSGQQSCAWHMDFGEDTTLTGKLAGSMRMSLVDSATGTVEISTDFRVEVVAGTGRFADQVGTGTFSETRRESIMQGGPGGPPGGGPPPGGPPAGPASLASTGPGALEKGSSMNLKLRKGKPSAKIVYPARTLQSNDGSPLHVVTAPGSRCTASAKKGRKRIKLGSDTADAEGDVTIADKLAKKLGKGKSTISVSCAYKTGKAKGLAKAGAKVTVS